MSNNKNRLPLPDVIIEMIQLILNCARETAIRVYVERVIPLSWHHPWTHSSGRLKAVHLVKCDADAPMYITVELGGEGHTVYEHHKSTLTYKDVLEGALTYEIVEQTLIDAHSKPIRITNVCADTHRHQAYHATGYVVVEEWEMANMFTKYWDVVR